MSNDEHDRRKADPIQIGPDAYAVIDIEARARTRAPRLVHPTRHPEYGFESNVLGVVGELAVRACLLELVPPDWAVRWVADSFDSSADIEIAAPFGTTTVEVKAFNPDQWHLHGRIIAVDQLYETDARAYVWCVAPRVPRPIVDVVGWSSAEETRRSWKPAEYTGQPRQRPPVRPEKPAAPAGIAGPLQWTDYDTRMDAEREYWEQYDEYWEQDWEYSEFIWNNSHAGSKQSDALAEGDLPRPGFGPSRDTAKVLAAVRPMSELMEWINHEGPPGQGADGHTEPGSHGQAIV